MQIGGLAVNHWAEEPMATANVDLVVALERVEEAVKALSGAGFAVKRFDWSIHLKDRSKVSIQIRTEDFYRDLRPVPSRRTSMAFSCAWPASRTRCREN